MVFLLRVISTAKFFVCPTQLLFKHYNTFVLLSSLYINADWIQNLFSVEISHCKPELFKFLKVADGLTQLTLWTFLCRCWEVGVRTLGRAAVHTIHISRNESPSQLRARSSARLQLSIFNEHHYIWHEKGLKHCLKCLWENNFNQLRDTFYFFG